MHQAHSAPLDQKRDPVRRPTAACAPLPEALLNHHVERTFLSLDKTLFLNNLKRARRSAGSWTFRGHRRTIARHREVFLSRRSSCAGECPPRGSDRTSYGQIDSSSEAEWERARHRGKRCVQKTCWENHAAAAWSSD